ncbi:hypothetical protein [Myceligenerans indicum]|uniref:Uncharacterized protein n=1 Tax=Myceligenerans indicum TaxID=2593663 RepID=A0ABS1LNQ9_9MICO|nr:hypothetical protein [Myceligenerans indicum]MBL0887870.1 hypothetical protein [Myceligenerans indicum]
MAEEFYRQINLLVALAPDLPDHRREPGENEQVVHRRAGDAEPTPPSQHRRASTAEPTPTEPARTRCTPA